MDYHLLTWKTKITAGERGALPPPVKKKGLFQMTDIWPCVGTLCCGTGEHPNINVRQLRDTYSIGTKVQGIFTKIRKRYEFVGPIV